MTDIRRILNKDGNDVLPITSTEAVRNPQSIGGTLESRLQNIEEGIDSNNLLVEQSSITDQQRNIALANVSNQTANSTTGKMGYKVLDPTKTFASQVTAENTIYEIRDVFDGGSAETVITIPAGSVLKNNGGMLKNCTVTLNNTSIQSDTPIFGENVVVTGNPIQEASPEWFTGSDADKIQRAIECFSSIRLSPRTYNIDRPIMVSQSFAIRGSGYGEFFGTSYPSGSVSGKKSILKAVDTSTSHIDCILWVIGTNAPDIPSGYTPRKSYVSALIEGVCFTGARRSNGINWSTPGGPSRPITIKNCSFTNLNHGLHIYGSTSSNSTNFGDSYLNQTVFTGCVWGIWASGNHAISSMSIESCLLEGNHNDAYDNGGAIYTDTTEYTNVIFGLLSIKDSELEGNPYGISLSGLHLNVILENNYFEWSGHDQNNVIVGSGSTQSKVIINNDSVTAADRVFFNIYNCTVEFLTNNGRANINKYIFYRCYIKTSINGIVKEPVLAYTDYDNEDNIEYCKQSDIITIFPSRAQPTNPYFIDKINNIVNGYPSFANLDGSVNAYSGAGAISTSDNCRLIFYAINNNTSNALISSNLDISIEIPCASKLCLYNYYIPGTVLSAISNASVTFRYTANSKFIVSRPLLVKDNGSTKLIGYNLNDYVGYRTNILNAENGYIWPVENDFIKYSNNGRWLDENGFTYASKRGTTAQRPSNDLIVGFNVNEGYEYYDTDIKKNIYFYRKEGTNVGSKNLGSSNNQLIESYNENTLTEGNAYRFRYLQVANTGLYEVYFTKQSGSLGTDYIKVNFEYEEPGSTGYKWISEVIIAPSVEDYPYICYYLKSPNSAVKFCYIYNMLVDWKDEYEYTAALSRGDTASRPTNLGATDSGFQYFDETLGKFICWIWDTTTSSGDWGNLDGTALS